MKAVNLSGAGWQKARWALLLLLAAPVILSVGCQSHKSYFIVGSLKERSVLRELFAMLEDEEGATRFTLIRQISEQLRADPKRQILFLTQYVEEHPKDPYNSFFLALVAEAYEAVGATPFAKHYYERILNNYPDLIVAGGSIHFRCLSQLIKYETNTEYLIQYYKGIISQFEKDVDVGSYYYYLARAYEQVGAWDLSIQAYKRFLSYPDSRIPESPDAAAEIREKVAFYESPKSWAVPDLSFLLSEIKTALSRRDVKMLNQYKAQVNFFAKFWSQSSVYENSASYFDINSWLLKSRVRYKQDLEEYSNPREAYLRTWNWQYHLEKTWYFYFRKIDFPADPEIHGRWEWTGIYFGEKG
jgi:tetratricopeptide (TPR) repeat protein